jgi:hypothetical protein
MPSSRDEFKRAHARLLSETPISDDATLFPLQEQVADFIREAKRRDPSEPDELITTVVDGLARNYFDHVIRRRRDQKRATDFWSSNDQLDQTQMRISR